MHVTVYADVLFLTNFLANLFLLKLTEKVMKTKAHPLRRIAAALLGGIYACASFFPELSFLQSILFRFLTALMMLGIAFRFYSLKQMLRCALVFLSALLLSGGCCYALFFMTQLGIRTGAVFKSGIFYWHVPVYIILLAFVATHGLLFAFEKLVTFYATRKQNLHTLCVYLNGNRVTLPALLDTGNALYDTVYALPVIIAEATFFDADIASQHRIPYRTLAGETHFLSAVRPERIEIDGSAAGECMLALTQARLCFDGQYHALIHPAVIQGGPYEHHAKTTADKRAEIHSVSP